MVTVAPEYAYEIEIKIDLAVVPPKSSLIYEVELVSFVKEKEAWDMNTAEKIEAAGKKKAYSKDLREWLTKHENTLVEIAGSIQLSRNICVVYGLCSHGFLLCTAGLEQR